MTRAPRSPSRKFSYFPFRAALEVEKVASLVLDSKRHKGIKQEASS